MKIYVDEAGYLLNGEKAAVSNESGEFKLVDAIEGKDICGNLEITEALDDANAGEKAYRIDFTSIKEPGEYYIEAADGSRSCTFSISKNVYKTAKNATLKAFYFQRCGCGLDKKYASVFEHPCCHDLNKVKLFEDPTTELDIKGGWHDAGDFGRYSTAASVALAHMLYSYSLFPEGYEDTVNIPESGNGMPDVLNECLYELKWLLKMQRKDGGVYHKLTTMRHADFIMPEYDKADLYVFPVSSMATADFAAVMALFYKVYRKFDASFAQKALESAQRAGEWLIANKEFVNFTNPSECNTGDYSDYSDTDDRFWAFSELLSLSGSGEVLADKMDIYATEFSYYMEECLKEDAKQVKEKKAEDGFGWLDVCNLSAFPVLFSGSDAFDETSKDKMSNELFKKAEIYVSEAETNPYHLSMKPSDFIWGSNMVITNRADLLITAALYLEKKEDIASNYKEGRISGSKKYLETALEQIHYILGRNAMDTSYLTAIGENSFKHPHNRPSECDGIDRPIPGQMSGGPCFPPLDPDGVKLVPKGAAPMKCYADDARCYSLNEITIYWNSSLLFALTFFDQVKRDFNI